MVDPARIWASSHLPSLPTVALRLLELSRDPETDMRAVIDEVRNDPALVAKILKATNSAFTGVRSAVSSIERAVPLLGTTVVSSLALSFSLTENAVARGPLAEHYRSYWLQSLVQATTADLLGGEPGGRSEREFFLAGMLIDIGRLAMLKTIPTEYRPVLEAGQSGEGELCALEAERLGFTHVDISVKLMENWKMPGPLIAAARLHESSVAGLLEHESSADFPLIAASATAAAMGDYFCQPEKHAALERLRALGSRFFGRSDESIDGLIQQVGERVREAGALFSLDVNGLLDPSELMAEANEQLAQLALRESIAGREAVARREEVEGEMQQLEARHEELRSKALRDPLTGVYNRGFFDDALEREAERCSRHGESLGLLFLDVDHFKQFNDTYGHQFGDEVLKAVAGLFGKCIRNSDVLARYGGEEFVVIVHRPTEKGLMKLAERIRERVEAQAFPHEGSDVHVTVSLGGAFCIPQRKEVELARRLVTSADEAVYEAKQNGRNQVRLRSLVDEWEARLANAVTCHRFSRWLVNRRLFSVADVSQALLDCESEPRPVGELAKQHGWLTPEQIEQILEEQALTGERFGRTAVRMAFLTDSQVAHLLSIQQENPIALANSLIRMRLFDRQQATAALERFFAEVLGTIERPVGSPDQVGIC